MTEAEASDRLRLFLVAIDAEAVALSAGHTALTDVIDARQTAPRPEGAYATITPLGEALTGEGDQVCYGTAMVDGVARVTELRSRPIEYGFRIDLYATDAQRRGRLFMTALRTSRANFDFLPASVRRITSPTFDPALVQQHWEGRSSFTVTLGVVATVAILIDVIESGEIALEIDGTLPRADTVTFDKG